MSDEPVGGVGRGIGEKSIVHRFLV
jgi:hypothetical protein